MMRSLFAAIILLTAQVCAAAGVALVHTPGAAVYFVWNDAESHILDATEGVSNSVGVYAIEDSELVTAGLDAGTYIVRAFVGTAGTANLSTDTMVAAFIPQHRWSGTVTLPDVLADASGGVTVTTNNDKTGYILGTDGIPAAALSVAAIDKILDNDLGNNSTANTPGENLDLILSNSQANSATLNHVDSGLPAMAVKIGTPAAGTIASTVESRASQTSVDALPTTEPLDAAATRAALGMAAADLDTQLDGLSASVVTETRDLEAVQHLWRLKRSGDGTLRSTNALYLHPGDVDIRAGWDCNIPSILPSGSVLADMSLPVSSDSAEGVNVDAELGIDPTVAKVSLSADADAVAGDYWITTTVTNSNGGGPITIYGKVTVQAAP